jgi:POT family proton-dependent oligopeptide transporter
VNNSANQTLSYGHPKGLYVLFMTEMWERFSYYGMRALLILYMIDHFRFDDTNAIAIYGSFTAMIFILPIFGGWIADKILGFKKAVIFGAILMCLGHFGMYFEGNPAVIQVLENGEQVVVRDSQALQTLYLSLSLLICGVGFLKSNITTIVGLLYPKGSYKRDAGFTIFQMGISIGSALAPVACGYLGQTYGWNYGFGLAGIGMLVGLAIFVYGQKYLVGHGDVPDPEKLHKKFKGIISLEHTIYLGTILVIGFIWLTIPHAKIVGYMLGSQLSLVSIGIVAFAILRLEAKERDRTFAIMIVFIITAVFAILIEQYGSSLLLFSERIVNKEVFGVEIKSSQLIGVLPMFIIMLAPFFSWMWGYLDERQMNPCTFYKFSFAFFFMGLAYAVVWYATEQRAGNEEVALIWLITMFFFFAASDLFIIPIGLSMVSKLSSKTMLGLMMGAYMLALSGGYYLTAVVAQFSISSPEATNQEMMANYHLFFGYLAMSSIAIATGLFVLKPLLSKLLHGIK